MPHAINTFSGNTLAGGLVDPVLDAQAIFRSVMEAMARPGTVQPIRPETAPPAPLSAVAGAVAATLIDGDTPVWLGPTLSGVKAIDRWLTFHTGAPITTLPSEAAFALVADPAKMPALESFAQGTQAYPDRSTTLVVQVASLQAGRTLTLSGPGIRDTACLRVSSLPAHFADQWVANNARFPRGVDVVLAGPDAVACLPRTVTIVAEEG